VTRTGVLFTIMCTIIAVGLLYTLAMALEIIETLQNVGRLLVGWRW